MNFFEHWKEVSLFIGFVITFISGRKSRDFKTKTEGAGAIEALQKIYDTYIEHNKRITDDLTVRLTEVEIGLQNKAGDIISAGYDTQKNISLKYSKQLFKIKK